MNAIVYICSDAYAPIAGVSLMSCLKNNLNLNNVKVFLFGENVSEKNQCKLREVADDTHVAFQYVDMTEKIEKLKESKKVTELNNQYGSSYATYGRLFIAEFLPHDIDRVLYIDCDTLVLGSVGELFELDLKGKTLGMVCDLGRAEYRKVLGIPMSSKYYSAGVMIIDLGLWVQNKCAERILEKINNGQGRYPLVDQDIINVLLRDEIYTLSPEYNFLSQCFLYGYNGVKFVYHLNEENYYDKETYDKAGRSPHICHFSGATLGRPWYLNSKHPMKEKYDAIYYASPWRTEKQAIVKLSLPYKLQYYLYRQPFMFISVFLGGVMQKAFLWLTYRV